MMKYTSSCSWILATARLIVYLLCRLIVISILATSDSLLYDIYYLKTYFDISSVYLKKKDITSLLVHIIIKRLFLLRILLVPFS